MRPGRTLERDVEALIEQPVGDVLDVAGQRVARGGIHRLLRHLREAARQD